MKSPAPLSPPAWNRRNFLKTSALVAGAATLGFPAFVRGQNLNSKLNIAAIGAGGKGTVDTDCCASENIVGLCDVDKKQAAPQLAKYPGAKYFSDYRKMLDQLGKSIDAVTVSTPDHMHAIAASAAMSLGKHVYCQKPLTQTVHEARALRDLARRNKIITQMGNQGSAEDGLRRAVEVVQSGILGQIREVHVWSNRPIWPQGMDRIAGNDPIPEGFDWNLWLGPAPERPFKSAWPAEFNVKSKYARNVYHPFSWRGWQDFGTGALGDMACHTVNMPFRGLQLGFPTEIEAQALGGMNQQTYPIGSKIRFQFPKRGEAPHQSALTFWWYDGGQPKAESRLIHDGSSKPPRELTADIEAMRGEVPGSGCLIVGEKGQLFSPDDYGSQFMIKLAGDKKFQGQKHPALAEIKESIPRNRFKGDSDLRHHQEWLAAIKENNPGLCYSRFDVAADLTEIMLLGCIALRVGKKIEWDGPAMRATNAPEAAQFIKRTNRPGWQLS